ncbi:MAG: right-handed parallel beta-helix repeat-containing protein [Armatimonadetes bacterium]|nr:right-handed parallel beta-helix repeat-containing protein [Armatimonadota bacterium]
MLRILLLWGWLWIGAGSAWPATYYISARSGSDANPGTRAKPWRTIRQAAENLRPGDAAVLRGGVYREKRFLLGPAGKSAKARTVFRAERGERVLLTGPDGTPAQFGFQDYMRIEGLWIGGQRVKKDKPPIFGVGGSPIGRGREVIGCTIFGYIGGILVGSSERLLIQDCRIVRCGEGQFSHGCYLSGSPYSGTRTQHVILDHNIFISGEGYAIHGWHGPRSCIITRNFTAGFFWDVAMDGRDHLIAHNTFWRNKGMPGKRPGWLAYLPGERIVFVNNILMGHTPFRRRLAARPLGRGGMLSHNAYLASAPDLDDIHPFALQRQAPETVAWIEKNDETIARIDRAFGQPVESLYADKGIESLFAVFRIPPPAESGLAGTGKDIGLFRAGYRPYIGCAVPLPEDFWRAFDRFRLSHYDNMGFEAPSPRP